MEVKKETNDIKNISKMNFENRRRGSNVIIPKNLNHKLLNLPFQNSKPKTPNKERSPNLSKSPIKKCDDHSPMNSKVKHHHHNGIISSKDISDGEYKKFTSTHADLFKEFSVCQFQNKNNRDYMEDRFCILVSFPHNEQNKSIFAIFDGHGGYQISNYLMNNFFSIFIKISEKCNNTNYEKILEKTFSHCDDEIKKIQGSQKMGSTATILLIVKEMDQILGKQKVIYCANLGDSNCQLINKNGYKKITYEHRCSDEMEEKRIKKGNGSIINGRVGGNISVTRSFGDYNMRDCGLISQPYINKVVFNDNEKNFLVLATDGVWDFLNEEELFFSSINKDNSLDICKNIMEKAKNNGSTDNMTCIVIKL